MNGLAGGGTRRTEDLNKSIILLFLLVLRKFLSLGPLF